MAAFSLIELLFVLGLAATLGSIGMAHVTASLDESRGVGAARYLSARLHQARTEAVVRNVRTALSFSTTGGAISFATIADGNRNGVLTRDIQSGEDPIIGPTEHLEERFPGITFATLAGLPPIDSTSAAPNADPIRLGTGDLATFTPVGTATSGTLYLLTRGHFQYAVRIFGETGRIRVLRFDSRRWQWNLLP